MAPRTGRRIAELVKSAKRDVGRLAVEECARFSVSGLELQFRPVGELSKAVFETLFDLVKENMQRMYERSSWKWQESAKLAEMRDDDALYLLARRDDSLVGFAHFRFDDDCGCAVLYCYEIQVRRCWQRHGVGRALVDVLVRLAARSRMSKVVSTVFKSNEPSLRFFDSVGFVVDRTSPDDDEAVDYVILSRKVSPSSVRTTTTRLPG